MTLPPPFRTAPCRHCGAPTRVRNGAFLRACRERAGLSLREMARRNAAGNDEYAARVAAYMARKGAA
jgi:hypothetical protein